MENEWLSRSEGERAATQLTHHHHPFACLCPRGLDICPILTWLLCVRVMVRTTLFHIKPILSLPSPCKQDPDSVSKTSRKARGATAIRTDHTYRAQTPTQNKTTFLITTTQATNNGQCQRRVCTSSSLLTCCGCNSLGIGRATAGEEGGGRRVVDLRAFPKQQHRLRPLCHDGTRP